MSWKPDEIATEVAGEMFPEQRPRVLSNGKGVYLVESSPFGRVKMVGVNEGFLVAAQFPPSGPLLGEQRIPEPLLRYLKRTNLTPWKLVASHDCREAIRALKATTPSRNAPAADWSPLLGEMRSPGIVVGESRLAVAARLARLLRANPPGAPLIQLTGPAGIGKREVVALIAQQQGWKVSGELPLSRLLVQRALATPMEVALETLLTAVRDMESDELLVVSDVEFLWSFSHQFRTQLLVEFSRLRRVVLLATSDSPLQGVISLRLDGLENIDEARELLAAVHPEVRLTPNALELAARASRIDGHGIVPGRLLYLIQLAQSCLNDAAPREILLAPDELTLPIQLAGSAWNGQLEA